MRRLASFALLLASAAAMADDTKIIIAHRGASGYLPEHTLEAYTMAHALGSHYIEPDLALTKDAHFICLHDIHLEMTTNVEEAYPDRKREDGRWYAIDFTLEEVRTLKVHERLPKRFPAGKADFRIPTLQEMIELVQGLNTTTGQDAGIYPELKEPSFHEKEGQPMEAKLLEVLKQYGYDGPDAKCFVQCFEEAPLRKMRSELGSTLPQIFLMGNGKETLDALTEARLKDITTFATGIGPDKSLVQRDPAIVARAHAAGLKVHPYTVRRDQKPPKYPTTQDEIRGILYNAGADGLFCDFPDDGIAVVSAGN